MPIEAVCRGGTNAPARWARVQSTYLEKVGALSKEAQAEVSTIRPARNSNASGIDELLRFHEVLQTQHLLDTAATTTKKKRIRE